MTRNVLVVVGSRANYSSIKAVMRAVQAHPELRLQVVASASALLDRYGAVVDIVEKDGFRVDARVHMLIEGETPATMAKSTGLGLLELPTVLTALEPDVVVTVGDRFETMATAIAAAYMNIPLAHTMGGEVSGTIDESVRHAITKLAHLHFPANKGAAERIVRMGEDPATVHVTGCPRLDLVREILEDPATRLERSAIERDGVGGALDLSEPYLLVSQYPVTTEYGQGKAQVLETMHAVHDSGMQAIVLWPNADAGSEDVASGIRTFRERYPGAPIRYYKNFPTETFIRLMHGAACLMGNSSAPIREGPFLGTPAVNVGTRQAGRERGRNVRDVGYHRKEILAAIEEQVQHGRYASEPIYGDGRAGVRIAQVLASAELRLQKRMTY